MKSNEVNILFIYPKPKLQKKIRYGFSLNIAYSSALLKQYGYNTFFRDLSCNDMSMMDVLKFIDNNNISIIAIEFDSFALKRSDNSMSGREILRVVKSSFPNIKTIAFGYECIMERKPVSCADITIIDDVLGSIISAVKHLLSGSFNYTYCFYKFDDLPFPDRSLIETESYYKEHNYCTLIQTSRGCLNSCSFCQRRGWQQSRDEHNLQYVLDEFRHIKENQYKNIWIVDENFTYNISRAKDILWHLSHENLTDGMKIAISSWSRIDKDFLKLAHAANIKIISMGIESANIDTLRFFKKTIDLKDVKEIVSFANKLGIYMVGNFIIGAPNEHISDIENTFAYIKQLELDQVNIKVLDYMIGSILYEQLDKSHYTKNHYFSCKETGLGLIEIEKLKKMKNDFLKNFYEGNRSRIINKINKFGPPYYPM